jgi:hypothetical protein
MARGVFRHRWRHQKRRWLPVSAPVAVFSLTADPATYALSGVNASLVATYIVSADPGAYTYTGVAATLNTTFIVSADPGTYVLNGVAATLVAPTESISADPGAYTLTGVAITPHITMSADPGTYVVSGADALTLGRFADTAAPGSYTLSGIATTLSADMSLSLDPGTYVLSGANATLSARDLSITGDPGSYVLSGADANLMAMGIMIFPTPLIIVVSASTEDPLLLGPSIRQRIMDRIRPRLERILIANGFLTDCGETVTYGKLEIPEPILPSINYWDGFETNASRYGAHIATFTMTVECYDFIEDAASGSLTTPANKMLADVKSALFKDENTLVIDGTLKGLARGIHYSQGDLITGAAPEYWVGVSMEFDVTYAENLGDPFTIPV